MTLEPNEALKKKKTSVLGLSTSDYTVLLFGEIFWHLHRRHANASGRMYTKCDRGLWQDCGQIQSVQGMTEPKKM